jgi:hypothetical protein
VAIFDGPLPEAPEASGSDHPSVAADTMFMADWMAGRMPGLSAIFRARQIRRAKAGEPDAATGGTDLR